MHTVLVIAQVLVAISLIGLILIQHGKGADAGAAFGSGASGTVFGARGAANFLTRTTAVLAAAFFASSLGLAYLVSDRANNSGGSSVTDSLAAPAAVSEPSAVAPSTAPEEGDAPVAVSPQAPAAGEASPQVPE